MHSALVSSQCPALDRLVNSQFKEAKEFHAVMESVNEDTIVIFTQYAYTGDYQVLDITRPCLPEPSG
jgi:hypothetical protein